MAHKGVREAVALDAAGREVSQRRVPLEASSAGRVRHRLNRGGNRRLNALLYRIAVTQSRASPAAQASLARREAGGKSRREALRALERHLVRVVWRLWQECLAGLHARPAAPARAAA